MRNSTNVYHTHSVPSSAFRKVRSFLLNRPFALLWSGQTISTFGSHISRDGLPIAAILVLEVSLRQTIIPDRFLGRVNATMHVIVGAIGPLGALVAGILSGYIGIHAMLFVGALGILLSTGWLFFSPLRHLKNIS